MKHLYSIANAVCDHYRISLDDLKGKCRETRYVIPRHVFMFLARRDHYSYSEIGHYVSGRDHSTVINGVKSIRHQLAYSDEVAVAVAHLQELVRRLPDRPVNTARVATFGFVTL